MGDPAAAGDRDAFDPVTWRPAPPVPHVSAADAVHAEHTFYTTCGSSLSVKAAMLAVAGTRSS
ncbi:hypothetical protein GCM10010260_30410 [Streptomyces filipinensis]|uniref:Uncharacterized protein n=1 Tax=Streptomyces filipinensis TaxID=66887 RepID=A0A918MBB0_9ACTN|nr:hypothetical protein GCM10010260_30410 [Streptomyces filipinensis]